MAVVDLKVASQYSSEILLWSHFGIHLQVVGVALHQQCQPSPAHSKTAAVPVLAPLKILLCPSAAWKHPLEVDLVQHHLLVCFGQMGFGQEIQVDWDQDQSVVSVQIALFLKTARSE
jgi:hypothetical protein